MHTYGRTGRTFHTRYKEHIQAVRSNNGNSGYSNRILNTEHTYDIITDTVGITKMRKKGKYLNTKKNTIHIKLVETDYI